MIEREKKFQVAGSCNNLEGVSALEKLKNITDKQIMKKSTRRLSVYISLYSDEETQTNITGWSDEENIDKAFTTAFKYMDSNKIIRIYGSVTVFMNN